MALGAISNFFVRSKYRSKDYIAARSQGKILAARSYCALGADHLIGIALVLIGVLALVGLPHLGALSSMPEWAKYGLIGSGGAYLIGTCVADAKLIHTKLKKKEEHREIQTASEGSKSGSDSSLSLE